MISFAGRLVMVVWLMVSCQTAVLADTQAELTTKATQKQVALIVEAEQLLASNARLSRIDAMPLADAERVLLSEVGAAVIAAATAQRLLAYGPVIGWREFALRPGETVQSVQAEDYAAFVTTTQRYINFNADTGIWAERAR